MENLCFCWGSSLRDIPGEDHNNNHSLILMSSIIFV